MNPHKKARRDSEKSPKKLQEVPLWAQKHQKDAEEEELEDLVFGGASFKQTLPNQDSDQEDLTGLEHVPDSQVSLESFVNASRLTVLVASSSSSTMESPPKNKRTKILVVMVTRVTTLSLWTIVENDSQTRRQPYDRTIPHPQLGQIQMMNSYKSQ